MTVVYDLVTDANGLITEASPEVAALLAIEDRWLVRKPLATFVADADRARFRTFLLELDRTAEAAASFVLEDRNGTQVAAELAATASDGTVSWHVTADTEPQPQKLRRFIGTGESERLFERLLNRLPHGIVVVDRELRIVFVNPAARRLVESEPPLRAGEPLPDPWPDYPLRRLAESLFTHKPSAGSHLVETGDLVLCVEGLTAGSAATATIMFDDVTERERTRQAERQFVENAAHELRTPLAAIVSVIDVLEAGAKDDPHARDRFLAHIRAHSERLVRLARSLLVLARIQTGRERPRLDLVRVEPLLQEVATLLVPATSVEVEVRAPERVAVLADPDLLYQALENVTANATKHTHQGRIVLAARDLGGTIEIEVSDTGSGMERTEAARAFDRFYRSASRDHQDGFGLGLAIADEAVRALGGSIKLDSVPDVGTRVRIQLPSAKIVS